MVMFWSEDFVFWLMAVLAGAISVEDQATCVILMQISGQMFMLACGLQEATTVVIGNAIGNNNTKLAKRYFKVTCQIGFAFFFTLAFCVWFWRVQITKAFTNDP